MTKHQLCRNCGETVCGNYCSACGQQTSTDRLTWASLADSLFSTLIGDEAYGLRGIDMRKGLVPTWLAILFHPYRSVSEFLQGHRRKYFNPVAILLLLSTLYAVVFMLVGKEFTPHAKEGQHPVVWALCTYYDYATLHPAANMLLMLPFFALAMKGVFRRKSDLRYVEYLYVGIFLAVFEITLMLLALPAEGRLSWYDTFYMTTLPVFLYTCFVFRRLFRLKKKSAVLRTLLTTLLEYAYALLMLMLTLAAALGVYYLVAPEQFKQEFTDRSAARQTAPAQPSEGAVYEVLSGVLAAFGDKTDGEETPADASPQAEQAEADTAAPAADNDMPSGPGPNAAPSGSRK